MLCSDVVDGRTRQPYFQQRERSWPHSKILARRSYQTSQDKATEKHQMMWDEIRRMQKEDVTTRPLWQISIHTSSAQSSPAYLTLLTDHVVADGIGTIRLVLALLSPDVTHLPYEKLSDDSRLENTIDVRPSYAHLLTAVWTELVLPRLPRFLEQYLKPPRPWPDENVALPPMKATPASSSMEIDVDIMNRLKIAGKAQHVPTLHPVLETAFLVAMSSVLQWKGSTESSPFLLRTSSPGSVRDSALGHLYCTSNYFSSLDYDVSFSPTDSFWVEVSRASAYYKSPTARKDGVQVWGLLAYVPDPDPSRTKLNPGPTGWEDHFAAQSQRPNPYRDSFALSNLGCIDLPDGADDLIWCQSSSAFNPPLTVNLVGHKGGLRMTFNWQEGSALSRDQVEDIQRTLKRILYRLVDPGKKVTKLDELVA